MTLEVARDQMRAVLRRAFPDPRGVITDEIVDVSLRLLPEHVQESAIGEVLAIALDREVPEIESAHVLGYYEGHARHERHGVHAFTGTVPMVLVRLPSVPGSAEDPERRFEDISTGIGIVFAGDHRLHSIEIFRAHYCEHLDFVPSSVELLTPARYLGARFAAVATYAARDEHGDVRAWVLEAGMATGEPCVLYLSEGGPITKRTWYAPTPFSSDRNFYTGDARFDAGGRPESLRVDVREGREAPPHITVTVDYDEVEQPSPTFASRLTVEAACRVAAIAEKIGKPIPGAELLSPLLAALGRELDWEVEPR